MLHKSRQIDEKEYMKLSRKIIMLTFLIFKVFSGQAQDVNILTASEKEAGWKLLFDGKTFNGWHSYYHTDKPSNGWSIKDGCLKDLKGNGRPGGGGGDLVTDKTFTDFEFSFEWNIEPGGNSGIYYLFQERQRSPGFLMFRGDDGTSPVGFEYQLVDDERHEDVIQNGPIRSTGSLYSLIPPNDSKKINPAGTFNQSTIIVKGKHIEHWLNGIMILSYNLGSPVLSAAIAKSKFKHATGFGSKTPTRILLQDHGNEIRFRNLKIRLLSE